MDAKTVVIGVLVVTAVLMGGVVANGLRQESAAYAQGGVYSTYLLTTARIRANMDSFVIIDTAGRKMLIYDYDIGMNKLKPSKGANLLVDFQRSKNL
jgi:hypothetical protein